MKNRKIKKSDIIFIISIIAALCILAFFLIASMPIKQRINKTLDGIEWDSDSDNNAKLTLNGYYYNYIVELWNKDYYEGAITIDGSQQHSVEWTKSFIIDMNTSDGDTHYYSTIKDMLNNSDFRAYIYIDKSSPFNEIVIVPKTDDSTKDNPIQYAFPAKDINEAKELEKRLAITN